MGTPQTIQIASLGMWDSLILMVMALVVFGPRRLPQIGRQIGKLMYEFRKASNDFKFQMEEELRNSEEADRRKQDEERMRALAQMATAPKLATPDPPVTTLEATIPPATAIESPYPDEGTYPPPIPPTVETPAPSSEETIPRIQPPSTGMQVSAARPGSLATQVEAPAAEAVAGNGAGIQVPETTVAAAEGSLIAGEPSVAAVQAEEISTEPVNQND